MSARAGRRLMAADRSGCFGSPFSSPTSLLSHSSAHCTLRRRTSVRPWPTCTEPFHAPARSTPRFYPEPENTFTCVHYYIIIIIPQHPSTARCKGRVIIIIIISRLGIGKSLLTRINRISRQYINNNNNLYLRICNNRTKNRVKRKKK